MLKKINAFVSMYTEPVFGSVSAEKRVMALSIDKSNPAKGLAREITRSQGNPDVPGFIDESKLILVESDDGLNWKKTSDLVIKDIDNIIEEISGDDKYFIGLEDPDIWIEKGIKHVYFTIAFKYKNKISYEIYLGHAQGKELDKLAATKPVLGPISNKNIFGFKEVAISPVKGKSGRIILTEAGIIEEGTEMSAIAKTTAKTMSEPWEYPEIVINPQKMRYKWCGGHVSPCFFFPEKIIKINDLLVGVINGREPEQLANGKRVYGKFRPGLILFNPKTGEIPWIAPEPLFEDPDARTITFASDFVILGKETRLYAHVNDSFIRAYKLNIIEIKKYIQNRYKST